MFEILYSKDGLNLLTRGFRPFHSRRSELSVQDGCLLWGSRVVIPPQGRALIMEELHETHPGVSRLKSLARSYVWWPGMDSDLERESQEVCRMSAESKVSSQGTTTPLGVARAPLVQIARGLCRTFSWQDVPCYCGCLFKIVGSGHYQFCHFTDNY